MKTLFALLIAVNLTACSTPPKFLSNYFDSNDPCQPVGKRDGYQKPNWCGASAGRNVNIVQGLSRNDYIVTVK